MIENELENFLVFDSSKIKVSDDNILKLLGTKRSEQDAFTLDTIKNCIAKSYEYYQPQAVASIQKCEFINAREGIMGINSIEFSIGKIISSQIKNAEYIAFFACTNGKALETHFDQLFKNSDLLEAYIFSLIGSEAVESLAGLVHEQINNYAEEQGLKTTNRYSPGYCKWNVAEQHKLFKLFPKNSIPIQLTESALMNPIKSVSGIIGLGKNVINKDYQCKACAEDKCIYRDRK